MGARTLYNLTIPHEWREPRAAIEARIQAYPQGFGRALLAQIPGGLGEDLRRAFAMQRYALQPGQLRAGVAVHRDTAADKTCVGIVATNTAYTQWALRARQGCEAEVEALEAQIRAHVDQAWVERNAGRVIAAWVGKVLGAIPTPVRGLYETHDPRAPQFLAAVATCLGVELNMWEVK